MTENAVITEYSENAPLREKLERLNGILRDTGRLAVAFSGGVDSTFLLLAARRVLGQSVLALTAVSPLLPEAEREQARAYCEREGIRQILCHPAVLDTEAFRTNPPDRCYHCKRLIFTLFCQTAAEQGFPIVADGSNADDGGDYRPGMRAVAERGIRSPLREAGLRKADIRELSREWGLATWDRPSAACLASRIAYGEAVTVEKLERVDRAEAYLRERGFRQVRVRFHGDLARIEVQPEAFPALMACREEVTAYCKALGFLYVTLDLTGYRMGSMNESLHL